MTAKKYLIYYFDIILVIYFLIGHQLFTPYMVSVPVRYYSTSNPNNNNIDSNKDKWIYREIYIID